MANQNLFTPKADIPAKLYITLSVCSFVVLMAIWSVLTYGGFVPGIFLPTPGKVFSDAVALFTAFNLLSDIGASVIRVTLGFIVAAVFAAIRKPGFAASPSVASSIWAQRISLVRSLSG